MSNDKAKRAAGSAAAMLVQEGMKVGLGTGSTAFFFIEELIKRCQDGLKIQAVATSVASTEQAQAGNIPLIAEDQLEHLDLVVDGADEIDREMQMIKGGGGALFHEKIIASAASEMVVVVDENKIVDKLGKHKLPIEITPFGVLSIRAQLKHLGVEGELRIKGGELYKTDSGNLILDADIEKYPSRYQDLDAQILRIPGVIETGFFWNLAKRVIVGYSDGHYEIKETL